MATVTQDGDGCLIRLKVVPGSSRDALAGVLGDRLKVKVAAAPEGGKANKAVCILLASVFDVKPRDVSIIAGATSPEKTAHIKGVTVEQVRQALKQSADQG
ncbi:MAG: DUF167 domain-containing protein [Phycisphaeraceae bacterium]|nr:DUF167 domain-containing protein [Phycisphaeraceae bacterium]